MVFLENARHGLWIRDVNNSIRYLLTSGSTDQQLRAYITYFNASLWKRLTEEIPDISAYQDILE